MFEVGRVGEFGIMGRTFFLFFLLILTGLGVVSGCGDSSRRDRAVVFSKPRYHWGTVSGRTITVWGNQDDVPRPYLRRAFDRYHALTGNTVRAEAFSHQEFAKKLTEAFAPGCAARPDILLSFGGVNIESMNPDENVYDFTSAPWVNELTDAALNQAIFNGKVIGLPYWEASVSGILYNKDLFREYGIAVPRTQEEFLATCETLLRHGITPVYFPFQDLSWWLYQFPLDSVVCDVRVLDDLNSGRLSYADIPEMRKIVSWYKTMADRGYFGSDYRKNGKDGMDKALRDGSHAMVLGWDTWLYTDFTGDPSRFGLMPAFMGVPERGTFEGPNLSLLVASRQGPQLDAALDLIAFIADPYNYNVTLAGIYTAPVFKNQVGSTATPQYVENARQIERLFHDSVAWPRIRGFSQLDTVYIRRHIEDPAYSVEDCLKDMDAARVSRAAELDRKTGRLAQRLADGEARRAD